MKYFLEQVANQLYDSYGNSLNKHCLVFPNRRAGMFLMKHLAAMINKPIWSPKILTVNELFNQCSSLRIATDEQLVIELFKIYREMAKSDETIDNFYFWGEMLVNDFDDIDKYLVDAKALFTNISDLHAIDNEFGGLTTEQVEVIRRFFKNFREGKYTPQKCDFEFNWSILFSLYNAFNQKLIASSIAYEGMIAREVAEKDDIVELFFSEYEKYHFVGFNALNNCEKKLMKRLKACNKAEFYWDYNDSIFFKEDSKSGFFLDSNIQEYGQSLRADNGGIESVPKMTVIDVPSDSGQAKLLASVLQNIGNTDEHHKTAVILANENLLPAVLSSIPPEIPDINVTMGYPFNMTVTYSLLKSLLSIQDRQVKCDSRVMFDYRKVLSVLSNPLVAETAGTVVSDKINEIANRNMSYVTPEFFSDNDFLKSLFVVTEDTQALCGYLRGVFMSIATSLEQQQEQNQHLDPLTLEFLFRANQVLNRMEPLIADSSVCISKLVSIRLLDRVFREIKVPFSGEPLKGLQVMGILESRALDFDNLIMLSVNEGVLPKASAGGSYIPYNFREAFGLPVITHQDTIYSYYFTRLLTKAKNVTFIYNSSAEGLRSGEMSRFLLRLKYSNSFNLSSESVKVTVAHQATAADSINRTQEDVRILEDKYLIDKKISLSPSAINTWLNCKMKFYYSYVCNIKEPDKVAEGIDPLLFGNLVHEVARRIYTNYKNEIVTTEIISRLRNKKQENKGVIDDVMQDLWFGGDKVVKNGTSLIVEDIAYMYLNKIFDIDICFAPFTIIDLEVPYKKPIRITYDGKLIDLLVGGTIDRIDERGGVKRLIDYKTGTVKAGIGSVGDLFLPDETKVNDAVFQTMLYCLIMHDKEGYENLRPVIYALRSANRKEYEDKISIGNEPLDDFSTVKDEFVRGLQATLEDIFNRSVPFIMVKDTNKCRYCCYKNLCRR